MPDSVANGGVWLQTDAETMLRAASAHNLLRCPIKHEWYVLHREIFLTCTRIYKVNKSTAENALTQTSGDGLHNVVCTHSMSTWSLYFNHMINILNHMISVTATCKMHILVLGINLGVSHFTPGRSAHSYTNWMGRFQPGYNYCTKSCPFTLYTQVLIYTLELGKRGIGFEQMEQFIPSLWVAMLPHWAMFPNYVWYTGLLTTARSSISQTAKVTTADTHPGNHLCPMWVLTILHDQVRSLCLRIM